MVQVDFVLVPLFGVHYALLLAVSFAANLSQTLEITWLYIDQTFSSFQGSFVALLYCFFKWRGAERGAQDAGEVSREGRPEPTELAPHPVPDLHQQSSVVGAVSAYPTDFSLVCSSGNLTERKRQLEEWRHVPRTTGDTERPRERRLGTLGRSSTTRRKLTVSYDDLGWTLEFYTEPFFLFIYKFCNGQC
ncbi:hypothetical protein CEXT_239251 [Caerostris extrusa]|uniref:Uncharacterized protein n=1 Tax=Caerostris extrusa TaxID=172846 RepID=A0AAV4VYU8_CAEEX|nr:hypothetical protein CEXT_239251 [Caerostris extrusa]